MKTTSTSVSEKIFHFVFTFLTSAGLGYSLVNQFILEKSNKDLLLVMLCLFLASIALWQRKKYSKK
ncbi:hypothetical protein [Flavobacterium chilense]|uniref:Uncharacterized protein n=1 Tax=Flavobacterium chilense TaxID=946677 RepID=A0A1M7DAN9_9FLAO|nr:hypothetical protein [Flavobacterium chilense]SHL76581.1 hypothetical protein SAMN05444484_102500 [Flavobacterium chilense]